MEGRYYLRVTMKLDIVVFYFIYILVEIKVKDMPHVCL